jgi:hypothetical protein
VKKPIKTPIEKTNFSTKQTCKFHFPQNKQPLHSYSFWVSLSICPLLKGFGFGFGFGDKSFMKTSPKNHKKGRFPKIKILKCLAL